MTRETTPRHRKLVVVRGTRAATLAAAKQLLSAFDQPAIVWIGDGDGLAHASALSVRSPARLLGRSFDAVVLDAHDGIDAEHLGQSAGLVWGQGVFVLRLPATGCPFGVKAQTTLAAYPHPPTAVGRRFERHLERALQRAEVAAPRGFAPPAHDVRGTAEQSQAVEEMAHCWLQSTPTRFVLTADRGRGKSSALGLAAARSKRQRNLRIIVTAANREAVQEVFGFADAAGAPGQPVQFVPLADLVFGDTAAEHCDVVIVDEAAQLPLPLLERLVHRCASTHLALATTTHGYEGTGRGFSLRFVSWLEKQSAPVTRRTLVRPIRWDPGDPVERFVFDALLLNAEPSRIDEPVARDPSIAISRVDRDQLVADERRLRALFGLLVQAHYRTTPKDLHRLLDAPNLEIYVAEFDGKIVGANLVAIEGRLDPEQCEAIARGRWRIRAHALPDLLVAHMNKIEAGELSMTRSVRIATHPAMRRARIATRLVEHVHKSHHVDLFGTVFGATAELIAFRRSLGYEVIRLSAARGARSGEPSVLMCRAESQRARLLISELRAELARTLPAQLQLFHADGVLSLDPAVTEALGDGLPEAQPLSVDQARRLVESYAWGSRTFESVPVAAQVFLDSDPSRLDRLDPQQQRLVRGRVLERRGWRALTAAGGHASVPTAMRTLRRAFRSLLADD